MGTWPPAPDGKGGLQPPPDAAAFIASMIGRQALGAIPNGARVVKVPGDLNDRTPIGTLGTVNGSVAHEHVVNGRTVKHGYVVTWDGQPDICVFASDFKIKEAVLVCVRQEDTWRWPEHLGEKTAGVCADCAAPIFFEKQNVEFRKICFQCSVAGHEQTKT